MRCYQFTLTEVKILSEDEVISNEIEEEKSIEGESEEEEEDSELVFTSIEDIELLVKNTEVWDNLLQGKISLDEAKKAFEENFQLVLKGEKRKKKKGSKKTKAKKTYKSRLNK